MKKALTLIAAMAAVIISTQNVNATIRRVGAGTSLANIDYTTLQAAHDAAAAGDTIQLYPGTWTANYSKKLVTIGYGYFTTQNANLQAITGLLTAGIVLNAGSDSCFFTGVDGLTLTENTATAINNITVNRCNANITIGTGSPSKTYSGWQITQCYLTNFSVNSVTVLQNLLLSNNIVTGSFSCYNGGTSTGSATIANCIFAATTSFTTYITFIVQNCIFTSSHNADGACQYQNNLYSTTYPISTGSGNVGITSTSMNADVFVGYSAQNGYSNDGRFALKPGSPAIGAGIGGADCGVFAGLYAYRLSGIPAVPAIYKLTGPYNATTNPYTINFSVRSNN